MTHPKVSRFPLSLEKCFARLNEGGIQLAIANLPTLGVFLHSSCHSFSVVLLDWRFALECVTLKWIWRSNEVAFFLASLSALSLPGMSQWLGHHATEIDRFSCVSRMGHNVW